MIVIVIVIVIVIAIAIAIAAVDRIERASCLSVPSKVFINPYLLHLAARRRRDMSNQEAR